MLKNKRGISLVETVIAMAAMTVLMMGGYSMLAMSRKEATKAEALYWLTDLRRNIITNLKNEEAFKNSVLRSENFAMECLKKKIQNPVEVVSCSGQSGPIRLVLDKVGKTVYEARTELYGFDYTGQPCDTFDASLGNDRCPFRYELHWRALCANEGCSSPDSMVQGVLKVSQQRKDMIINADLYGFNIFIPGRGEKSVTTCEQSLLGTFSGDTNQCRMNLQKACPEGQYVVGFLSNGEPNCSAVNEPVRGACTGASRMRGVDANGNAICVHWCI